MIFRSPVLLWADIPQCRAEVWAKETLNKTKEKKTKKQTENLVEKPKGSDRKVGTKVQFGKGIKSPVYWPVLGKPKLGSWGAWLGVNSRLRVKFQSSPRPDREGMWSAF